MSLRVAIFLVLSAMANTTASADDQLAKPATKIEAFQTKTGVVLVRGYTDVGTINGLGGIVTVGAREFRDASNPTARITGISIEVKETGRLERANTSFVDGDEIDGLLRGLDYIAKATQSVSTLHNFEVEYRTKGDFSVTVFNGSDGQLSAAVSSGRIGKLSTYLKLQQLPELKQLILDAKSKL